MGTTCLQIILTGNVRLHFKKKPPIDNQTNPQHSPYKTGSSTGYVLLDTRVKTHKITPAVGMTTVTLTLRITVSCFTLWQYNCLPPHPLILDFTMPSDHYKRSTVHTTGKLTHTRSSDGAPNADELPTPTHAWRSPRSTCSFSSFLLFGRSRNSKF